MVGGQPIVTAPRCPPPSLPNPPDERRSHAALRPAPGGPAPHPASPATSPRRHRPTPGAEPRRPAAAKAGREAGAAAEGGARTGTNCEAYARETVSRMAPDCVAGWMDGRLAVAGALAGILTRRLADKLVNLLLGSQAR